MDSWRSAICGSFLRKACIKGRTCNYLHVFRNPTKEFVKADHDWKEPKSTFTGKATPQILPANSHPSPCIPNEPPQPPVVLSDDKNNDERNEVSRDDYTKRKRDLICEKSKYADTSRSESASSKSKHARKSSRSEHSRSAKRKKSHKKKKSKKVKKSKKHLKKKTKD